MTGRKIKRLEAGRRSQNHKLRRVCASDNKEFQSNHNNNKERLEAFTASYGDRKLVAQVFLLWQRTRKVKDFKAIVIKIDEL